MMEDSDREVSDIYESLDSILPDEDWDEYITVSTPPHPYLCPENTHKATATSTGVTRDGGYLPMLPLPKKEKSPIPSHEGGNHGSRKYFGPVQVPNKRIKLNPIPVSKNETHTPRDFQNPIPRQIMTDYQKLEDKKPLRPPKPKLLNYKMGSRKTKTLPPPLIHGGGTTQSQEDLFEEESNNGHTNFNTHDEEDILYDEITTTRKRPKMAKSKKIKTNIQKDQQSKDWYTQKDMVAQEASSSDIMPVVESPQRSPTRIDSKRELDYSVRLREGSSRVLCVFVTIALVSLAMAVVSLIISLFSIGHTLSSGPQGTNNMIKMVMRCSPVLVSSNHTWEPIASERGIENISNSGSAIMMFRATTPVNESHVKESHVSSFYNSYANNISVTEPSSVILYFGGIAA